MKKLFFLIFVIFCISITANANLSYDKEYWIKEISKTNTLNQKMISKHFDSSPESFAENIFGISEKEIESWRKTTLVIASIIKKNEYPLKRLSIDGFNHQEFNDFYINTFLDAIINNKTIENLSCSRVPAIAAFKIADIIKLNKIVRRMDFADSSNIIADGAFAIAKSLSKNNTLQVLKFTDSKFSMSARKELRKAWSMNKVNGREQQIEF